jgi:hypothetical protein
MKKVALATGLFGVWAVAAAAPLDADRAPSSAQASAPITRTTTVKPAVAHPVQTDGAAPLRVLLDKYCVKCHNQRAKIGGLTLDDIDVHHLATGAETWEKVLRKLRTNRMPPVGNPKPDDAERQRTVLWLDTSLDKVADALPNPGRASVHRLNRFEYSNAVRDLLALEIDAASLLPADQSGYGFDNIADVLAVSPGLMERYLIAADKMSRLAVGDATIRPAADTVRLPYLVLRQDERMSNDLPAGSRGGVALEHNFPLDGEYVLKLRMQRHGQALDAKIRGLDEENEIDVRLDGVRLKTFLIGGSLPPGPGQPPLSRTDPVEGDSAYEVRFFAKAGRRLVGISMLDRNWMAEGVGPSRLPVASWGYATGLRSAPEVGQIFAGLDQVDITGPFNGKTPDDTPSRRRLFVCQPASTADENACAAKIISTFAHRAFRRPIRPDDVTDLMTAFQQGRAKGKFDQGVQAVVKRVLADPEFLFRIERDPPGVPPGGPYHVSDLELASRLSFFLWSTIPDDILLHAAERGTLHTPIVFEHQVKRMLEDERADAWINNFFDQWLLIRNIRILRPDEKLFPEFDENLREAFQKETELFLRSQVRENQSILELLTANYTFVNERLAKHYDIPNVYGSHFRRVTYPDDRRAGLLGQGSVLTVTSYANRTSPVVRGKWLLENLLASPPPPPPPNVPPLKDTNPGQAITLRDRMQVHRKNPVCANCHNNIDPLGLALENFDAIGKWRNDESGAVIDPTGAFPDGTKFDSPATFRRALLRQPDEFATALTEKLLTYAIGRGVEYYDMPVVRRIVKEAAKNDYRWSSLIMAIVKSRPFQMRKAAQS